jgi:hypothetical protein
LTFGGEVNDAWSLFLESTAAGHRGLCLSREFPDRLRALLGPREVRIVWLSSSGRPGSVRAADLVAIREAIRTGVETDDVRAVYLDGVEYLARANPVDAVVRMLREVESFTRAANARVWVSVHPMLAHPADIERLLSEFPPGS